MVAALAEHAIDLVVLLSPWPETFSYVMHEALAAGADVVALAPAATWPTRCAATRAGWCCATARRCCGSSPTCMPCTMPARAPRTMRLRRAAWRRAACLRHHRDVSISRPPTAGSGAVRDHRSRSAGNRRRRVLAAADRGRHVPIALPAGTESVRWCRAIWCRGSCAGHGRSAPARSPCPAGAGWRDRSPGRSSPRRRLAWCGGSLGVDSGDATIAVGGAAMLEVTLERLLTYIRSPLASAGIRSPVGGCLMDGTVCFTSFSLGYLSRARVLARSVKAAHPDWRCSHCWSMQCRRSSSPRRRSRRSTGWSPGTRWRSRDSPPGCSSTIWWRACTAVKAADAAGAAARGCREGGLSRPRHRRVPCPDAIEQRLDTASIVLTPHQCVPSAGEAAVREQ